MEEEGCREGGTELDEGEEEEEERTGRDLSIY